MHKLCTETIQLKYELLSSYHKNEGTKKWIFIHDMIGCTGLGYMYEKGDGVRQDMQKAKSLFSTACDGGDQDGCKNYRRLNKEGI